MASTIHSPSGTRKRERELGERDETGSGCLHRQLAKERQEKIEKKNSSSCFAESTKIFFPRFFLYLFTFFLVSLSVLYVHLISTKRRRLSTDHHAPIAPSSSQFLFFFPLSAPRSTSDPASSSILHHLGPLPLPPLHLFRSGSGPQLFLVSLASRCSHSLLSLHTLPPPFTAFFPSPTLLRSSSSFTSILVSLSLCA